VWKNNLLHRVDVDHNTGRVAWVAAQPDRDTPAVGAPGDLLAAPYQSPISSSRRGE